jgi:sulfite reductase (NADPH) flavoprotein alpha-component
MLRRLHSLPGLIAALLLAVLAFSGAILSINPALERGGTTVPADGQVSVAALADRVMQQYASVEQIQRTPSGSVIVYYSRDGRTGADYVDPSSGRAIAPYAPSGFSRWMKNLHRSFLADTPGRAVAGVSALTMLILCLSGLALLAKRQGGWRNIVQPLHGNFSQRWHAQLGRIAALGLLLSALTGMYMSAATFGLISDGTQSEPSFPTTATTGPAAPGGALAALLATDVNDLRELVYPDPRNPSDFYSLRTTHGSGYIDPSSGKLLSFQANNRAHGLYELVYQLHTGEGLWWLGLLLGLCGLSVPLMSATGLVMWLQRRASMPRIAHNSPAQAAEAIILVGSETNNTWGFAKALHDALRQAGQRVHTAPMNQLAAGYRKAQRVFILTSTYGDGSAPQSANQFLTRLAEVGDACRLDFAVLGFGDRQFPKFCQFAKDTRDALLARGWRQVLELDTIDRQSAQEFARWGRTVGRLFDRTLTLVYTPRLPPTHTLKLISRVDYGTQVQAPTSILRFGPVATQGLAARVRLLIAHRSLLHFEAGDLVGIIPSGSPMPRFYSLASQSKDGFLEICVRRHPQGVCSQMLYKLQLGERIEAFIQPNPNFRPASGKSTIILIGAGTGIGPLAGFIRNNTKKYPMYLYWGGRDPASDFLYESELVEYLADHRLTQLNAAFSRVKEGGYVQDRITADALQLRQLIRNGAQILVCGGRAMAASITQAINEILVPLGLDVETLKLQGRYREDIF